MIKKCYTGHWIWADSLEQPKQWKMGETWKVWNLYRLGSLMTSARELSKYRLHLIEHKSDGCWTSRNYTFFYGKCKSIINYMRQCVCYHIYTLLQTTDFINIVDSPCAFSCTGPYILQTIFPFKDSNGYFHLIIQCPSCTCIAQDTSH